MYNSREEVINATNSLMEDYVNDEVENSLDGFNYDSDEEREEEAQSVRDEFNVESIDENFKEDPNSFVKISSIYRDNGCIVEELTYNVLVIED